VALAAVISAKEGGRIAPGDSICVNLTGGGVTRLREDHGIQLLEPDIIISDPRIDDEELKALFK
jgi:hypothetical protein